MFTTLSGQLYHTHVIQHTRHAMAGRSRSVSTVYMYCECLPCVLDVAYVPVVTTYNQSRDHGEQRLGILSLLSQIRISTLDIA